MKKAVLAILFAAVLAAGVAGGLLYTWVLEPVEYIDAAPDSLYILDKLYFLGVIGDLYVCEGDLALVESRLATLGLEADGPALAGLIEEYLDRGGRTEEMRGLAQLAKDLGASGGVLLVFSSAPKPSPEATLSLAVEQQTGILPGATPSPLPPATPAPTYQLVEQTALCGEPGQPGKIIVEVQDPGGSGVAGVQVVVSWPTGQDQFYTGLRPDLGTGYADFDMKPDLEYAVDLVEYRGEGPRELVSDLAAGICPTRTIALSWKLTFQVSSGQNSQ